MWNTDGMILTEESGYTWGKKKKPVPVPLATPKLPWTDLQVKTGLCCDRMVTNCVSHGTVILVTQPLKYFLFA